MEFFENFVNETAGSCPCDDYGYYGGCDDDNCGD